MLKYLNTYRSFIFGLLVVSYVFSVFQKPIIEVAHFMCHVPSMVLNGEKIHSYSAHENQSHQHGNLEKIEFSKTENEDQPHPQNNQELKKKIEIIHKKTATTDLEKLISNKNFQVIFSFQTASIKILSPPPQFG